MKSISMYRLAKQACLAMMTEADRAATARHKPSQGAIPKEEALACITNCMCSATALWNAYGLLLSHTWIGGEKHRSKVAAMYRVVMREMASHMLAVGNR